MARSTIRISNLNNLSSQIDDYDIIPVVHKGKTYSLYIKDLLQTTSVDLDGKEDVLGNPTHNDQYLSSDIQGNRSWRTVSGTGGPNNAENVYTDTTNFNQNLYAAHNTVQKTLDVFDDFMQISVVGNNVERGNLNPKHGDFCLVTDDNITYIYKDSWLNIQREDITISTVATIIERDALISRVGDVCIVTSKNQAYIFSTSGWIEISAGNLISDSSISANTTWSSLKITTVDIDGGDFA